MQKEKYLIILFYKFSRIRNPEAFKIKQKKIAEKFGLKGRMLIAEEGVNATFEGRRQNIKAYERELRKTAMFKKMVFKESEGTGVAFTKLMVKVRPEIVTLGAGEFNIKKETAKEVTAKQLEKMYEKKEDFVVLDLRNDFEVEAGYFENTYNPHLRNFRDLPEKIGELEELKNKKVVAVCTGGIRCEKATCLLKREGFENIYQLKDGIHTYMKEFPGKHFKGSLFVFDNRMVTRVVDEKGAPSLTKVKTGEIVGKCAYCGKKSEDFYNDDSIRPSRKTICCAKCIVRHKNLRPAVPEGV